MVSISSVSFSAPQPAAYTQVGQIPVGQETGEQRLQRVRPVEQAPRTEGAVEDKRAKPVDAQDKRQQAQQALEQKADQSQLDQLDQLKQLASRDREVRAHELAHKAAAGSYGGAIRFEYQRGPDGNRYAVGGEVDIDTSPESSPEATLAKARTIQRAANAPAQPSDQDRAVAAQAVQMAQQALQQIAESRQVESRQESSRSVERADKKASSDTFAVELKSSPAPGDKPAEESGKVAKPEADGKAVVTLERERHDKRLDVYVGNDIARTKFHARA
ncbi:MAG: hypothetical protein RL497_1594 [Pseudomonadota bacterium]|jgi:hypothetical protein